MRRFNFSLPRTSLFYLALLVLAGWIIWRLVELQLIEHQTYLTEAEENRITRINEPAPRGVIYDRRGTLLARNLPSFAVSITPAFLPDSEAQVQAIYRRLSELLKMPIVVPGSTPRQPCREGRGIADWVDEGKRIAPFSAVKIKCDIDQVTAFQVRQEISTMPMPGVEVIVEPVRDYPTGALTADLIGYMAPIPSPDDAPLTYNYYINRGLRANRDRIGVQGIEASMQDTLAGQNGSKLIEEDVAGQFLRVTSVETETVPGLNVQLTIDVRLQRAVEAAFLRRLEQIRAYTGGGQDFTSGVVIVMNPNTGEIYAMVSWPTYDNNKFARNIDFDYYTSLVGDETRGIPPNPDYPMLNHAVQILYPPGSVFKLVTATGALEEKVIDPKRQLDDPGKITIRNSYFPADPGKAKDFVCWILKNTGKGHGKVDFIRGIAQSCNVYFYKIGGGYEPDHLEGLGDQRLAKWMQIFGFGARTGIELPAEQAGFIPTRDWKRINQGESWSTGDTYNAVIGQGFVQVTPLQLLNAYNSVINGGHLLQPQLVDKILDGEGNVITDTQPVLIRDLPVAPENIKLVQQGLRQVAIDGTLSGAVLYGSADPIVDVPGINVAGKTGTAEYCDRLAWSRNLCIPGRWPAHAWTVMFAPYEHPEVSVVAFVYNGTEGSIIAGPIANAALRAYFEIIKGIDLVPPETPPEQPPAAPN